MKQLEKHNTGAGKILLVVCNIVLLLAVISISIGYTAYVRKAREQTARDTFCTAVESMKQISVRYLDSEKRYVSDWVAYIEHEEMTEDEALEYLRTANSRSDRYAHIVDMDTLAARSTEQREEDGVLVDTVNAYQRFAASDSMNMERFVTTMKRMFHGRPAVLGKYRIQENQTTVISVGEAVQLRQPDGSKKSYLLLRAIPVDSMKKNWIFPSEYSSAEIGLITSGCDYVIQAPSMRPENFVEFIRSYNFADDYNGVDAIVEQIASTRSGLLSLKNSKGQDCYWYYSALDGFEGLDIVGCIPQSALASPQEGWNTAWLICGTVLLLACVDGAYILSINRRLRSTVKVAEEASAAKTQFLSSMSHDIRTPLNAVLGMTELAKKRVEEPEYVAECLNKISVSGTHLLTLINDILEISKVESGKVALNPAAFSVEELVSGMESIIRSQADSRGLTLKVELGPLLCPYLVGDKLRLSQIYLNLLTNAVKYTNPGGAIRLAVREEPVGQGEAAELICVVQDNGIGMSEEFQRSMYDSFSRAQDSRIDKIQGTGLGLAIAKRMAELMGGTIACESQLGEGTTFTVRITLPAARKEDLPQPIEQEAGPAMQDLQGLHLLVAEDNDLNWEIIQAMLTEQGIVCDRAENGQLCVETLERSAPGTYALVLMDIQMPVLNGRDAARQVRQSEREDLHHIPIVAMTADAFAEDVQACLDAGMNAHLAKPVELEKVLATIRRLCKK